MHRVLRENLFLCHPGGIYAFAGTDIACNCIDPFRMTIIIFVHSLRLLCKVSIFFLIFEILCHDLYRFIGINLEP